MRILFCNIAWMNYYKGNEDGSDAPWNGGSYVCETGDAHEKYNFSPTSIAFDDGTQDTVCLGFVETKTTSGDNVNQLHIERIAGCELLKNEESVEDVLVVYCASHPAHKFTTVVGWYRHATVYRYYQSCEFSAEDGSVDVQCYNAIAKDRDCVLLPSAARARKTEWGIPRTATGASYGFGRSNVWFANGAENNQYLNDFLKKLYHRIKNYNGENWLCEGFPEK